VIRNGCSAHRAVQSPAPRILLRDPRPGDMGVGWWQSHGSFYATRIRLRTALVRGPGWRKIAAQISSPRSTRRGKRCWIARTLDGRPGVGFGYFWSSTPTICRQTAGLLAGRSGSVRGPGDWAHGLVAGSGIGLSRAGLRLTAKSHACGPQSILVAARRILPGCRFHFWWATEPATAASPPEPDRPRTWERELW